MCSLKYNLPKNDIYKRAIFFSTDLRRKEKEKFVKFVFLKNEKRFKCTSFRPCVTSSLEYEQTPRNSWQVRRW